jgi:hypothetical protein
MDKEYNKLRFKKHPDMARPGCWDESRVRPWAEVAAEARREGRTVHFGTVFGICVEKGSELPLGHKDRKFKGRFVFRGNDVRDQNYDHAIFQELGSSPAALEAGKSADYGLHPGNSIEQSVAEQAYTQSLLLLLLGTETWVELPEDRWPPEWKGIHRPVVPLELVLYGHPDSGGYWEEHAEKHVMSVGFERILDWHSCFWHPVFKTLLIICADDFKLAGPTDKLPEVWRLLRKGIVMEEPHPMGNFLGGPCDDL